MARDIMKITAALNAYPWTRGTFSVREGDNAVYCAVGLLLRYAGVPQAEIACAGPTGVLWDRFHELFESEYGITEPATIDDIIRANDSALSHDEAIEQVQFVLNGGNLRERLRARHAEMSAAAARQKLEDDGNACGALVG